MSSISLALRLLLLLCGLWSFVLPECSSFVPPSGYARFGLGLGARTNNVQPLILTRLRSSADQQGPSESTAPVPQSEPWKVDRPKNRLSRAWEERAGAAAAARTSEWRKTHEKKRSPRRRPSVNPVQSATTTKDDSAARQGVAKGQNARRQFSSNDPLRGSSGRSRSRAFTNKPVSVAARKSLELARAGQGEQAVAIFRRALEMRESNPEAGTMPVKNANQILAALGDGGHLDLAMEAYEALQAAPAPTATVVTYCTIIARAASARRPELALRAWKDMERAGVKADVPVTNALLNAFAKAGWAERAVVALEDMRHQGLRPNIITFNTVIDALGRSGNLTGAAQVFQAMEKDSLRPTERTFAILIHACARLGRVDDAFGLLRMMKGPRHRLEPNAVTYSTLIDACGRGGDLARAFDTFRAMLNAGLIPNVVTWTSLVDACVKHASRASVKTGDSGPAGPSPPDTTPSSTPASLSAGAVAMTPTPQLPLLPRNGNASGSATATTSVSSSASSSSNSSSQSIRSGGSNVEPNVAGLDRTNDLSRDEALRLALGLFRTMLGSGVRPNRVTCTALMDGCLKCGEIDLAFELFDYMRHAGLEPSRVTFTSLLHECTRLGRAVQAAELLRSMDTLPTQDLAHILKDKVPAGNTFGPEAAVRGAEGDGDDDGDAGLSFTTEDRSLGDVLVELLGEGQRLEDALFVVRRMLDDEQAPDGAALAACVGAADTSRRLDDVIEALDALRAAGHKVNEVTYAALVASCGRANEVARAFDVVAKIEPEDSNSGDADQQLVLQPQARPRPRPLQAELFGSLMEACRTAADGAAALRVFEDMQEAGISPSVRTYTSMVEALSRDNAAAVRSMRRQASPATMDGDKSQPTNRGLGRFLRDMGAVTGSPTPPSSANPVTPSHSPASPVSSSSPAGQLQARAGPEARSEGRAGVPGGVKGLGRFLRDTAPQSDANAEIDGHDQPAPSRARRAEDVTSSSESAIKQAQQSQRTEQVEPAESMQEVQEEGLYRVFLVFRDMRARGLQPDCAAYNALMGACARAGDRDKAFEVLQEMTSEGVDPDVITYTSLIKSCGKAKDVEMAEELFRTMLQQTSDLSESTFAELMRANIAVVRPARALKIWGDMKLKHKLPPTIRTFRIALKACEMLGDWERAIDTYERMRQSGIRLDNASLLALVRVLEAAGQAELAASIRQERSRVIP